MSIRIQSSSASAVAVLMRTLISGLVAAIYLYFIADACSLAFAQTPAAAVAAAPVPADTGARQAEADYELGPGDTVRITVFQNPDLTTEARVSESGQISFPLLGTIKVGGRTLSDAGRLLSQRLRAGSFVAQAEVTVNIIQFRSQQVSVLGMVGRPGRYPIEVRGTKLTEVLALAGGILPMGADQVIVIGGDPPRRREIDLPGLYLYGRTEDDIVLNGGDSLYVHRAPQVYVFGQVQRPGNYQILRDMTVSQAVATAGGFTLRARQGGIVLKRAAPDGRIVSRAAGQDDAVRPNDQIYVEESLF